MPRFNSLPDISSPGLMTSLVPEMCVIRDILEGVLGDFRMPDGYEGVRIDRPYMVEGSDIQSLICAMDRLNRFLDRSDGDLTEDWWVTIGVRRDTPWYKIQARYRELKRSAEAPPGKVVAYLDRLNEAYRRAKREKFA